MTGGSLDVACCRSRSLKCKCDGHGGQITQSRTILVWNWYGIVENRESKSKPPNTKNETLE
jgi:hypothetical protein